MKSGIQMNFLERRASADRALSQLVGMVREVTETLSSWEQGGVYRLEATLVEKSNAGLPPAQARIGSALAARLTAFSTIVLALVRGIWSRVCAFVQGLDFGMVHRLARARARVSWGCDLARVFIALRAHDAFSRVRVVRQWLRRLARRAHLHWLLVVYRHKVD